MLPMSTSATAMKSTDHLRTRSPVLLRFRVRRRRGEGAGSGCRGRVTGGARVDPGPAYCPPDEELRPMTAAPVPLWRWRAIHKTVPRRRLGVVAVRRREPSIPQVLEGQLGHVFGALEPCEVRCAVDLFEARVRDALCVSDRVRSRN